MGSGRGAWKALALSGGAMASFGVALAGVTTTSPDEQRAHDGATPDQYPPNGPCQGDLVVEADVVRIEDGRYPEMAPFAMMHRVTLNVVGVPKGTVPLGPMVVFQGSFSGDHAVVLGDHALYWLGLAHMDSGHDAAEIAGYVLRASVNGKQIPELPSDGCGRTGPVAGDTHHEPWYIAQWDPWITVRYEARPAALPPEEDTRVNPRRLVDKAPETVAMPWNEFVRAVKVQPGAPRPTCAPPAVWPPPSRE